MLGNRRGVISIGLEHFRIVKAIKRRAPATVGNRRIEETSAPADASATGAFTAAKRILVPVDFSETSKRALSYAQGFANQFGASLTLVHVVEPFWYPHDWDYVPGLEGKLGTDARKSEARKELSAVAKDVVQPTVPVTPHVRSGTPWNEIVIAAKEHSADLIIIGTHGRTGLKHVVMGSTAERVVRHAGCPVLVVR